MHSVVSGQWISHWGGVSRTSSFCPQVFDPQTVAQDGGAQTGSQTGAHPFASQTSTHCIVQLGAWHRVWQSLHVFVQVGFSSATQPHIDGQVNEQPLASQFSAQDEGATGAHVSSQSGT